MRFLTLLALGGCGLLDGDLSFVALEQDPIVLTRAEGAVDAWLLEDCEGGTVDITGPGAIDLLSPAPEASLLPSGRWCALGVSFADDEPFVLEGTASGSPFSLTLSPGLVLLDQEFVVDHDEWVLVLEAWTAIDAAEPRVADSESRLPTSLFLGTVHEARDTFYVDLWPFPDIAFGDGVGDVEATGGCNGGETVDRDPAGDGGEAEPAPKGDGDGQGGGGGESSSGGGGGGGGCDGGGGCSGGSGDCSGCDLDTCSTVGFAPPISFLAALVLVRRRRSTG